MNLSDLVEVKRFCEIDPADTSEDAKLGLFIEIASDWIQEILGRDLEYKNRTEYYNGTGTRELLLRARPVFTDGLQVFVDQGGYYGAVSGAFDSSLTAWTYGTDYCLKIDQDNGSSRSGVLVALKQYWPKQPMRTPGLLSPFIGPSYGSVKVIYNAGYTVDTLPAQVRAACDLLVSKLRYLWPLGMEVGSESYEERSISLVTNQKDYLLGAVKPLLTGLRNQTW